jgi:hypothetical protein
VNKRSYRRSALALERREKLIFEHFLAPHMSVTSWVPGALDGAASYVGLLHAECEGALESGVTRLLAHAQSCAEHGYAHPVLINAVTYYQSQVRERFAPIALVPRPSQLRTDATKLADVWRQSGAASFWTHSLKNNHGAGLKYLERLLQPLGLDLGNGTFVRVESQGVVRLATAPSGLKTDLTEFVNLRGRAVHTGADSFHALISTMTPGQIRRSGQRAYGAVAKVAFGLVATMW